MNNIFITDFNGFVNEDFNNIKSEKTVARDLKKFAMSGTAEDELQQVQFIIGGLVLYYFQDHVSALHKWTKFLFANDKNDIKKVINALKPIVEPEHNDMFTKASSLLMNHLNQSVISRQNDSLETDDTVTDSVDDIIK